MGWHLKVVFFPMGKMGQNCYTQGMEGLGIETNTLFILSIGRKSGLEASIYSKYVDFSGLLEIYLPSVPRVLDSKYQ